MVLARQLQRQGWHPLVLERARGVGGRCATRRVGGQPVDHGVAFLHGRTQEFCDELDAFQQVGRLEGWPLVRDGDGSPCRPEAFAGFQHRVAFAEGVNRFAKHLARDVEVRLEATVSALDPPTPAAADKGWALTLASGERLQARVVALALPAPSAIDLLRRMVSMPEPVAAVLPLLRLVRMVPCLTVIARYADLRLAPPWDVSFPRSSAAIHTVLHDSGKRIAPTHLTLVIQARAAYSRAHALENTEAWTSALLAEAAALHGRMPREEKVTNCGPWQSGNVAVVQRYTSASNFNSLSGSFRLIVRVHKQGLDTAVRLDADASSPFSLRSAVNTRAFTTPPCGNAIGAR